MAADTKSTAIQTGTTTPTSATEPTQDKVVKKTKGIKADQFGNSPVSYDTIVELIRQFKMSGTNNSQFNTFDSPGHSFFKIVFHFWNGDAEFMTPRKNTRYIDENKNSSASLQSQLGTMNGYDVGFLAPTWDWGAGSWSNEAIKAHEKKNGNTPIDKDAGNMDTKVGEDDTKETQYAKSDKIIGGTLVYDAYLVDDKGNWVTDSKGNRIPVYKDEKLQKYEGRKSEEYKKENPLDLGGSVENYFKSNTTAGPTSPSPGGDALYFKNSEGKAQKLGDQQYAYSLSETHSKPTIESTLLSNTVDMGGHYDANATTELNTLGQYELTWDKDANDGKGGWVYTPTNARKYPEESQMRIIDKIIASDTIEKESEAEKTADQYNEDQRKKMGNRHLGGIKDGDDEDLKFYNSAYNFLIRNAELERAEKLKQFILLLSSISTYSPWYFSEVHGLDSLADREVLKEDGQNGYKYEKPKTLTIKCLPDAMDNRIGTLMDLYRDIVYSYIWKREVVPSNLRKFDMSIYIFESPLTDMHYIDGNPGIMSADVRSSNAFLNQGGYSTLFPVSYKLFELHECEFDYNGVKSGYTGLNNTEGFQQVFEIPILVGDAYEYRYNMFMDRVIGDFSIFDMFQNEYHVDKNGNGKFKYIPTDVAQYTHEKLIDSIAYRLEQGQNKVNLFGLLDKYAIASWNNGNGIQNWLQRNMMGNIYGFSLDNIQRDITNVGKALRSLDLDQVAASGKSFWDIMTSRTTKNSLYHLTPKPVSTEGTIHTDDYYRNDGKIDKHDVPDLYQMGVKYDDIHFLNKGDDQTTRDQHMNDGILDDNDTFNLYSDDIKKLKEGKDQDVRELYTVDGVIDSHDIPSLYKGDDITRINKGDSRIIRNSYATDGIIDSHDAPSLYGGDDITRINKGEDMVNRPDPTIDNVIDSNDATNLYGGEDISRLNYSGTKSNSTINEHDTENLFSSNNNPHGLNNPSRGGWGSANSFENLFGK